eukprot:GHVN01036214.1.p1 GENE.GHVN01036214.1~~GHVN01036214.1.p1  ORF type:complete len:325 (-),score=68.78 GHVN01036214.1:85-1059(-)
MLPPMAAAVGGIAAEEAIKAATGTFTPLQQVMAFECIDSVPVPWPSAEQARERGSRYDSQICVVGETIHRALQDMTVFIVGAGAIGCEVLKNLALMGVGTSGTRGVAACQRGGRSRFGGKEIRKRAKRCANMLVRSWRRLKMRVIEMVIKLSASDSHDNSLTGAVMGRRRRRRTTEAKRRHVGGLVVCDNDLIELSNLSRQVLFSERDINKPKASIAAQFVRRMNSDVEVTPVQSSVLPASEHIFDERFWRGIDCVFTALDNVPARLYVDSQCVAHKVPLLESGTLGLLGSTQVVIPFLTESYASSYDPPEGEGKVPVCSIKSE